MTVEVGAILDGTVSGITKFGAFIDLGNGATGLCHISEVAGSYVRDVSEHLQEKQPVRVKVLAIDERGRVSLSIRQAAPASEQEMPRRAGPSRGYPSAARPRQNDRGGFEDMLSSFLKESDDKIRELKTFRSTRKGNGHRNG